MKFRNLITAAALAALPVAAQAATLIIPAVGTGPGANNSQWQSEVTIHTVAPRAVTVALTLHQGTTVLGPVSVELEPRTTLSLADVVRTKFNVENGTGALVLEVTDRDAKTLAVTSRTFNVSPDGEFGQDIPSVDASAASRAGDIATLNGPSSIEGTRFNFGAYAVEAAKVQWQVVRADGSIAATRAVDYAAGQHVQYNGGIRNLLGAEPAANDTVYARVLEGQAVFYGSVVNATGDPTFVPAIRTREDILIHFTGVDLDENGTIDVADANGDGVLDNPVVIYTSMFPSHFALVAEGEFGEAVEFEIVSSPAETALFANGGIRVAAGGEVKGKTGELVVRATSGNSSSLLRIPLRFR